MPPKRSAKRAKKAREVSKLAEKKKRLNELENQLEELKSKWKEHENNIEETLKKNEDESKNLKLRRVQILEELQEIGTKLRKNEIAVARHKIMKKKRFDAMQQCDAGLNRFKKALNLYAKSANRKDSPADSTGLQASIADEELEEASQKSLNLCQLLHRQREDIQRQIDQLEDQVFGRATDIDENRAKKLSELRMSLDDINAKIKDLLENPTNSDDAKASESSKLPADIRTNPLI